MQMLDRAHKIADEMIRLRRDIHAHPELGFQEFRTAALVADTLREIGIDVQEKIGRTGVIGTLGNGDGPTIAIRADMDALPILERNDIPYKSTTPGVMHACGHDAHTAILLGVAHLLKRSFIEEKWHGNVRFLFQPSEEQFDDDGVGGADAMIQDDALDGVDQVIALHVASGHELGTAHFCDGYAMAAVDSFEATIRGKGGHGASPHRTRDPLYMLSLVLPALYGIPSRFVSPMEPSVVTVGEIRGGSASNIIPESVYLQGTLRSKSAETRTLLRTEVENAFRLVEPLGGSYDLNLVSGCPALFNNSDVNTQLKQSASAVLGQDKIVVRQFGMGYEDFSYMAEKAPGAMFMLGAALPDGDQRGHHTDIFNIDERALPLGAAILAETAQQFCLKNGK